MSSYMIDVSGARPLTPTINDPAATKVWMPAKQGDDVSLSCSGRETRIAIGGNVRLQRRRYHRNNPKRDDQGQLIRDANGDLEYEQQPYEQYVLVLGGGFSGFVRGSSLDGSSDLYPSMTASVRRYGEEAHFLESGELLEEISLEYIEPVFPTSEG